MFRKIGIVAAAIAFVWFLVPYIAANILNIGNITGMAVALLLLVYLIVQPRLHTWIRQQWHEKYVKVSVCAVGALMALVAILAVVETGFMISACAKAPQKNATAVVLGCRVYGERASMMLRERLEAAYEYLTENPEAVCVVSGGQGSGEDISEAECMKRWLVDKGITETRIYKEDMSTSTEENIAFTKQVLEENDLNPDITIITNEFHAYRAGILAEKNDLEFGVAPGNTAIWLLPTYYIRELYAILAEWVF